MNVGDGPGCSFLTSRVRASAMQKASDEHLSLHRSYQGTRQFPSPPSGWVGLERTTPLLHTGWGNPPPACGMASRWCSGEVISAATGLACNRSSMTSSSFSLALPVASQCRAGLHWDSLRWRFCYMEGRNLNTSERYPSLYGVVPLKLFDFIQGSGQPLAATKCGGWSAPPALSSAMGAGEARGSCLLHSLDLP